MYKFKKDITQDNLKHILSYDPLTGLFINNPGIKYRKPYAIAGSKCKNSGYVIIRIDGSGYMAHRLVWLYMAGEFPLTPLDHINHIRSDNRWDNLRPASVSENQRNQSIASNNSSGAIGVRWNKKDRRWIANIAAHGKRKYLGGYKEKSDAIKARKNAEIKYGYHLNHGRAI